ncbi:MAG: NHL repeat-containing protein [Bacteroidota bacterium]
MKQKIILFTALVLLLALVAFMVKDFFFSKPGTSNPYEFKLDAVRTGDTTSAAYAETGQIKPEMEEIHGLTTDASGRIYVAGKDSVEIFDASGKTLSKFRITGTALCIALDESGNIFLGLQDHIEIWRNGKLVSKWNSYGTDAVITSITVKGNNVFVADAGQKVVYRFDKDGKLINKIGLKDPAIGVPGFIIPSPYFDLCISSDGNLWVVNPGRHSFEKYTFDGKLLNSWGKASMAVEGFCGCCNPSNFAMIQDSLFVTAEKAIERVKIYNANGTLRCLVATPGQFEEGTKGLDLAVDNRNRILVLDPVKKLIRIFEAKK